ncbi:Response regulatory domain-containing protein [Sulfidibacter corallicola]|uniref:Response regulatory domain-containing protein n=1 Tax=Sulfidibacter corallicola TaxID=2818388 RepID=A0A8A4THD9_SULCO|nr:hypothetical protein [Sulfidibacter corallicola]QTD49479.1 hypothetical protein J3U87_28165 [Sulfidibacter corallicola]
MSTSSRRSRVLIVSDHPDRLEQTHQALLHSFPHLHTATTSCGRLLTAEQAPPPPEMRGFTPPNLVLLDFSNQAMASTPSATSILEKIRGLPAMRHIPILVLHPNPLPTDIHTSYQLGANALIPRPIHFNSLVNTLRIMGEYWLETVILPKAAGRGAV